MFEHKTGLLIRSMVGVSSIVRDITHRKQIEAALRERNALRYVASLAAAEGGLDLLAVRDVTDDRRHADHAPDEESSFMFEHLHLGSLPARPATVRTPRFGCAISSGLLT